MTERTEEVAVTMKEDAVEEALGNPLILGKILENLSGGELRSARLVGTTWHDASLLHWRSKAKPTLAQYQFRHDIFLANQTASLYDRYHYPITDFLQDVKANVNELADIPFRQFVMGSVDFGKAHNQHSIKWFLEWQGDHLTNLELNDCKFVDREQLQTLIYKWFPNLQSLSLFRAYFPARAELPGVESSEVPVAAYGENRQLKSLSVSLSPYSLYKPLTWTDLFSHFPSLTSLKIIGDFYRIQEITDILNSIKLFREQDASNLRLNNFAIIPRNINYFDKDLGEIGATLRELKLSLHLGRIFFIYPTEENLVAVKELLELHGEELLKIEGFTDHLDSPLTLRFPYGVELKNLKELEISLGLCSSLEFLKGNPNIRRLQIFDKFSPKPSSYPESQIVSRAGGPEMQNLRLTNLTLFRLDCVVSEGDLRCLIKWMPNLRKVRMVLDDNQFGIVCERWGSLKVVEVMGKMLSDRGVLGIKYTEGKGTTDGMEVAKAGPKEKDEILPNITLLQKLTNFCCHSSLLTSASVYNGFLKMPRIKMVRANFQDTPSTIADCLAARKALLEHNIHHFFLE